jgi:hypothetical protein
MPFVFRKQSESGGVDVNVMPNPFMGIGPSAPPVANPQGLTFQQPPMQSQSQLQQPPIVYPEHIQKKIALAAQYDCTYVPTPEDIKDIEFNKYREVFKSSLVRDILFFRYIKDPHGKEYLVYKYQDTVLDDAGDPHVREYYAGCEEEAIPSIKRNNLREITDISFDRKKINYTIPFSKEAVQKALDEADNVPTDLAVAYGNEFGSTEPWRGNELTINSLEAFTTLPFDILERLNKEGWNTKDMQGYYDMVKDDEEPDEGIQEEKRMNIQKTEEKLKRAKAVQQQQQQKPT